MKCAKCAIAMTELDVSGVAVDRCPRCHGVWFDRDELRRVVALVQRGMTDVLPPSGSSSLAAKRDAILGTCPRCEVPLERRESLAVQNMHYDGCRACEGAWLDGDELARITESDAAMAVTSFFSKFGDL
jgi:Zn-finger nucleic acid-binding protein